MLSSALSEVENFNKEKQATPQNVNFDILYLAAREGVIDLEEAGDILLANCGCLGRQAATYTQTQLDRKMRIERSRMSNRGRSSIAPEVTEYLIERQLDDLIDASNLTSLQEICFRLSVAGLKCKNMATTLGLNHCRTAIALRNARIKVRAAYKEGKHAGWYDVYLSEVNRTHKA